MGEESGQANNVRIVDADGIKATVRNLAANDALNVALVDSSGNQITSFGGVSMVDDAAFTAGSSSVNIVGGIVTADSVDSGDGGAFAMLANRQQKVTVYDSAGVEATFGSGTQYTEDAAAAANPVGTALNLIREDARGGSLTTTDGDNVAARGTNAGELYVKHVDTIAVTQSGTWDEVGINDSGNSITVDNAALSVVGGGVEATALRVTVASDSTGVLSVDDNGGALTVDNAGTFATQVTGDALTALQLIDNLPVAVDTALGATPTGALAIAIRDDALSALTPVEGDAIGLRVDANGALWTHDDALDAALSGSELQVDVVAALPTGANTIGAVTNTVLSVVGSGTEATAQRVTIATDSTGVLSVDDNGGSLTIDNAQLSVVGGGTEAAAMRVTIANDSTGVLSIDDNGGSLTVDGTVAVTLAAGAAAIAKAEDVASADADVGVPAMAVRKATPANVSGTDGDYEFLQISAGRLWASATIDAALPAGANAIGKLAANSGVDIGDVDVLTLPNVTLAAGTNTNEMVGDAAHDAAIAGNPVRIGGRALTADYTAVAAGDTADFITTLTGKQVMYPYANPNNTWSYAAPAGGLVTTTAVTIKAAAGANVRNYITDIQVVNSHATVSTELTINDGAAGTVLWRGWLQAAGGGYSIHFNTPLRGTANTLLEIDEITATGTTGVLFDAQGFTAAE